MEPAECPVVTNECMSLEKGIEKKGNIIRTVRCAVFLGAWTPVGHGRTEAWEANKGDCRWSVCASARKRSVCSGKISFNVKLTAASRADLRRPLPSALLKTLCCLPTSRNVNTIFFCWRKTEVFYFATVSKSILNTKTGILMALRKEPLKNEGTGRHRMICSAPLRTHTCALRVAVVITSPLNVTLFLAFKGETFAGSVLPVSFSHALL